MNVVVSTIGRFHSFDQARQFHRTGELAAIYSAFPWSKLKREGLPREVVRSFPPFQLLAMAMERTNPPTWLRWRLTMLSKVTFDRYVARTMPSCEVFIGLSSSALASGRGAKQRGALYVCDRGSTHIRQQDNVLREEHEQYGLPYPGIDPQIILREESEYAESDMILVPSDWVKHSFVERGVSPDKVAVVPYGVDLSRFYPDGKPDNDMFDVLFVGQASVRKGLRYLLTAFEKLSHPRKRLTFVGGVNADVEPLLRSYEQKLPIRRLGRLSPEGVREAMSTSHVLCLPSIEEGLALVQAQALACGCPVVASRNAGCENLFTDGGEGFIVGQRDTEALVERLSLLANDPARREAMSSAALSRVRQIGGWDSYGDQLRDQIGKRLRSRH